MEWGPQLKHLKRFAEAGQSVPALENQPLVSSHMDWAWKGYVVLDKSRQWGQGFPQPIQVTEIMAYATGRNMSPGAIDDLIDMVQHLDGVYLSRLSRRQSIKAGTTKKGM